MYSTRISSKMPPSPYSLATAADDYAMISVSSTVHYKKPDDEEEMHTNDMKVPPSSSLAKTENEQREARSHMSTCATREENINDSNEETVSSSEKDNGENESDRKMPPVSKRGTVTSERKATNNAKRASVEAENETPSTSAQATTSTSGPGGKKQEKDISSFFLPRTKSSHPTSKAATAPTRQKAGDKRKAVAPNLSTNPKRNCTQQAVLSFGGTKKSLSLDVPKTEGKDAATEKSVPELDVPRYCIERAKRKGKNNGIEKGDLRAGTYDRRAFDEYGYWKPLKKWRVPYVVWKVVEECRSSTFEERAKTLCSAPMKNILKCEFETLEDEEQDQIVSHIWDQNNWANANRARASSNRPNPSSPSSPVPSLTLTPGKDGAVKDCLAGFKFAITGRFPELGGGSGIREGQEQLKKIINDFGGAITTDVSSETDFLLVGEKNSEAKVARANVKEGMKKISWKDLKDMIHGIAGIRDL